MRSRNRRTIWIAFHLYLALTAGLLFVLLGLTGSLNVFAEELDELINPQLIVQITSGHYLPLDTCRPCTGPSLSAAAPESWSCRAIRRPC